jgi:hypothetical protein
MAIEKDEIYIKSDGSIHRVTGFAVHTETSERLVLHVCEDSYSQLSPTVTWAEPISQFLSTRNYKKKEN